MNPIHAPKWFVALLYALSVVFIEFAREFNMVGAEQLRGYDPYDWAILIVSTMAVVFVTVRSYFDSHEPTKPKENNENKIPPVTGGGP